MKLELYATIKKCMLILLIVFTVYYIGPMSVAINTGGLNKEDVVKKLPDKIKKRYDNLQTSIAKINRSLDSVNYRILLDRPNDNSQLLIKIHYLEDKRNKLSKEFVLDGLNFNLLTLIYPVSISLLAIVYFLFLKGKNSFGLLQHIKTIIPVYIFLMSFTWYRNTAWGQHGRTVFSAYNFDINPYVFLYQEFCVFSFVTLIVMIWNKCVTQIATVKDIDLGNIDTGKVIAIINDLKRAYYSWQFLSLVLFGVFGFYSFHFWSNVFIKNDFRYVYQAVIFNMLWIITWVICSIPTILKFEKWNSFKIKVLIYNFEEEHKTDLNYSNLQQYLQQKEIVSDLNKTVSTVVLISTFLFPLLKAWI